MVLLVWQFVAFLIGMMAAGWLLFIIGTFFVALFGTIAEYIKKSQEYGFLFCPKLLMTLKGAR